MDKVQLGQKPQHSRSNLRWDILTPRAPACASSDLKRANPLLPLHFGRLALRRVLALSASLVHPASPQQVDAPRYSVRLQDHGALCTPLWPAIEALTAGEEGVVVFTD